MFYEIELGLVLDESKVILAKFISLDQLVDVIFFCNVYLVIILISCLFTWREHSAAIGIPKGLLLLKVLQKLVFVVAFDMSVSYYYQLV